MDSFLTAVRTLPDGADVRVRLVHHESGKSKVCARGAGLLSCQLLKPRRPPTLAPLRPVARRC